MSKTVKKKKGSSGGSPSSSKSTVDALIETIE
jgi:hypothetical protein